MPTPKVQGTEDGGPRGAGKCPCGRIKCQVAAFVRVRAGSSWSLERGGEGCGEGCGSWAHSGVPKSSTPMHTRAGLEPSPSPTPTFQELFVPDGGQ